MSGGLFTCEVVYHGRRAVQGAQSSATLTALVDHLLHPHPPPTQPIHTHNYVKQRRSERCQLVCDDEHIRVTPVRKDEGFESDTESSGSACDDPYCGTQDIKVISDHVLRLDQLISEDGGGPASFLPTSDETSSSATSSGAESEDDSPRTAAPPCSTPVAQEVVGSRSGGVGDLFLMCDILYCHVSTATPRVLVVVVKDAGSSQVHAHVFQCPTEDTARNLYAHYKEASNKYKLNRYRNSKRKTQIEALGFSSNHKSSSGNGGSKKAISGSGKPPSGRGVLGGGSLSRDEGGCRGSLRAGEARLYTSDRQGDNDKNVNVIRIRESEAGGEEPSPWNLVQHTDANGVTHIEIDSGPCSLAGTSTDPSVFTSLASLAITHSSQLSSSLNSVATRSHSRNNSLNSITGGESLRGSSSCPSSLVSTGREVLVAGELDKRSRQRQPPLLLRRDGISYEDQSRKSDERRNEDSLRRNETKKEKKTRNEWREDGGGRSRRDWHEGERGGLQEVLRPTVEAMIPRLPQERQPRTRDHSRARIRTSHNKGPAPPPPPRRHPDNPALLLVPTKSGAETARAFYPKESHIVRGNKIVRVEAGSYRAGWGCHDLNNNPHQYNYYGGGGGWAGPHEYHAPRTRETTTITPEMRRRSRSKSPARRPMAHRYIDAVSTFSLSQKLKDISDAVFTARRNAAAGGSVPGGSQAAGSSYTAGEVKGHQRSPSSVSGAGGGDGEGTLRPVIKKGRRQESSPQLRRVTFSAYATVQVMDA